MQSLVPKPTDSSDYAYDMGQNPVKTDLGTKQAAAALACAHMRSHLFPHVTPRVHPKDLFSGNPRLSKIENFGQIQCLQYAFE